MKTSILLLDKKLAKQTNEILFVRIENDGYDLGAQRREIDKNDLPDATEVVLAFKQMLNKEITENKLTKLMVKTKLGVLIEREMILKNKDVILSSDRYIENKQYDNVNCEIVKLMDVVEILDSKRKPITQSDRVSGVYPYYGATGIVDYVHEYIFDERLVLVGEDGAKWNSGDKTAFIAEGKYWVNNHAHVLRPIKEKIIDTFLVEILNSMDLNIYITGVTVPKLNQENMRNIQIPLPPIEVQRTIVAEIDSYQKIIDGARQVVENYKPSIVVKPSWQVKTIETLCSLIDYRGKTPTKTNSGIRLITARNVRKGFLKLEPEEFTDKDSYTDWMTRGIPLKGDVLFTTEAPLGNVAVLDLDEKVVLAQRIILLRPKNVNELNNYFLKYMLLSENVQHQINSFATGSTVLGIKQSNLRLINIPLPPLDVQMEMVDKFKKEETAIGHNQTLIAIFEQKIKEKISEVWGE